MPRIKTAQEAEKVTSTKTCAAKQVKKPDVKTAADVADLYVVTNGKLLATKRFKKHISPVYHCEELYWKGKLEKGTVISFMNSVKKVIPCVACYNEKGGPGYTLDGAGAIANLKVEKALTIASNTGTQIYNYINSDSQLVYIGDEKAHTFYVRIYDDIVGEKNGRWVVIDVE